MASSVALPLEKQFATIPGLTSINSTSTQGGTDITLQFDLSRNIDAAAQDVQSMIGRASRQLPPQMPAPPSYQKVNPADQSIFFIVLRSPTLPLSTLDEIAQSNVAQRISMVNGVAQVNVFGSQKYAVRIDVDPRELAARSIGIDEVASAVQNANVEPADRHHLRREDVRRPDQRPVDARRPPTARRSSPIATAIPCGSTRWRTSSTASRTTRRRAGRTASAASTCSIQKQPGINVVQMVDAIKALLPAIKEQLPGVGDARRPQRSLADASASRCTTSS